MLFCFIRLKRSKMTKKQMPETSLEAYRSLDPVKLSDTYKKIILALSELGSGTFEDIAKKMKVEKSIVWKRLSELERANILYKPGTKKTLKSGRMGFVWMILSLDGVASIIEDAKLKSTQTIQDHSRNIQAIANSQINKLF
jgi:predicted transcriptional regulator